MHKEDHHYHHSKTVLHGFLAYHESTTPLPAVLVAHDWSGRGEFACNKASMLADLGYVGFAVDMFGKACIGQTTEERTALIQPFFENRSLVRERMLAAFETVKQLPQVDPNRIAVMGFCFGGLCALDLARSGAGIRGAVSFHGILKKPDNAAKESIKAKVLVLHGYNDPMVPPEQVNEFCQEMTEAGADWQVHQYGHTLHAFTNPQAHDQQLGTVYNQLAEKRSMQAMRNFFEEIFQ